MADGGKEREKTDRQCTKKVFPHQSNRPLSSFFWRSNFNTLFQGGKFGAGEKAGERAPVYVKHPLYSHIYAHISH